MESEPHGAAVAGTVSSAGLVDLLVEQERQVVVDDRGVLLSPAQALAGRRLDRVLTSDLPDLAARWLVSGWDGPLLRELAGHPRQDAGGIDVVWAGVMQEWGLDSNIGEEQALLRMLPVQLARWRCRELSSRELAEELSRGWDAAHWDRVAGLGELLLLEEYRYEVSNAELGDVEAERETLVEQLAGATILIRR